MENTADISVLEADTFNALRPILGQIAHDFNNLLTPLIAYPSLLKSYLPEDSQGHELIDAINSASQDMIHINEQLMLLASRGVPDKSETPVAGVIESVIAQVSTEVDLSNVSLVRHMEEDLPSVPLSVEHFSKALRSLLMNAYESKTDDLAITISAQATNVSSEVRAQYGAPYAGEYLQISVADNGPGFDADILPKATVPFLTTKKDMRRRGSGLGLTVALVICRDHGGFLVLGNRPEGGASASIFLPLVRHADQHEPEDVATASGSLAPRNRNRILLVDDEGAIIKLFQMIVGAAIPDCEIETANNGKEALDLFSQRHHGCLVMDLHMPVMDGQTAFKEIHSLADTNGWEPPAVIFCTGFAPPDMVNRIVADNSLHCLLSKPVRGEVLVEAIKNRIS
jgi:nitrogen-specific signal transduction histidine kinase/CheY-like chemotaxis protein